MAWGRGPVDVAARIKAGCESFFLLPGRPLKDADVPGLADAIASSSKLKEIDLGGHTISPASLERIGLGVSSCVCLKRFVVGSERMGDDGTEALCNGLKTGGAVEELVLSRRGIQKGGLEALSKFVSKSASLRCLILDHNKLGDGALSGLAFRCSFTPLQWLHLSNCGLVGLDLGLLCAGLRGEGGDGDCRGVEGLVLDENVFADEDAATCPSFTALGSLPGLQRLSIERCGLGPLGADALRQGVAESGRKGLDFLRAGGNSGLGVEGAVALVQAWGNLEEGDGSVMELGLSESRGGSVMAEAIGERLRALHGKGRGCKVDVSKCGIAECPILLQVALTLSSCIDLCLFGNPLSPTSITNLSTLLSTPPTSPYTPSLTLLDLGGTELQVEAASNIITALEEAKADPSQSLAGSKLHTLVFGANPALEDEDTLNPLTLRCQALGITMIAGTSKDKTPTPSPTPPTTTAHTSPLIPRSLGAATGGGKGGGEGE